MSRFRQVSQYAWRQSKEIAPQTDKSRLWLFCDMMRCYRKYLMWTNQYVKEQFWSKSVEERQRIGSDYREKGKVRDAWQKDFRENRKFLIKYTNIKYEKASLREKRNKAYTERYKAGKNLFVEYDVNISRQHYLDGKITIGDNVLFSKHVFIDYSGEIVLGNKVKLSDGVTIESHRHEFIPSSKDYKPIPTKIVIEDGVWIGQKSIICEDVKNVGRYVQIGAGSVVRNSIPPYAIVAGNPARIVGFLYTPEEVAEFEKDKYPEAERTDIEKYTKLYEKYFINRMPEIKKLLSN